MGKFGTIVQIGDILVSEEVITEYFACDYEVCRGACCIIGDSGAPMEESEPESIERDYPHFSHLMRAQGRDAVDKKGFFEIDRDGDIVTPLVEGSCNRKMRIQKAGILLAVSYTRDPPYRRRTCLESSQVGNLQGCIPQGTPRGHKGLSIPSQTAYGRLR